MLNPKFQFNHRNPLVTANSACFRPPSFPPPEGWPVSIDRKGNPLSNFGDDRWDYRWMGGPIFNFGKHTLDQDNKRILKKIVFCFIFHPGMFPNSLNSVIGYFYTFVKIAKACSEEGILMSDLHRFPNLFGTIGQSLVAARFQDRISHLHKWELFSDEVGFKVGGAKFISEAAKYGVDREVIQNPYIPERIWSYQVTRLHEILEKFNENKANIESAYDWLMEAYSYNLGRVDKKYASPFSDTHLYRSKRIIYNGTFSDFLESFGLIDIIRDVIGVEKEKFGVYTISAYLTLIRDACVIYILNFSLQRKNEAAQLRSDCFHIEHDDKLGDLCLISSETTKTIQDSDARWVVPKNVELAIKNSTFIARLRLKYASRRYTIPEDIMSNPYLMTPAFDLWNNAGGGIDKKGLGTQDEFLDFLLAHRRSLDYHNIMRRSSKIFDNDELKITEEDARIARAMTPNIDTKPWFGVGNTWKFSTHQLRRTLAVNMFTSKEVSLGSLQDAMKHFSRNMTLYYLRNYANIRLDSKVSKTLIFEYYANVGRNLLNIIEDDLNYIKPHGRSPEIERLIQLVDVTDEGALRKLAKEGDCGVRETLLGFCVRTGECEYGGIESLVKCAGGNGKGVCADAIFSKKNNSKLMKLKAKNDEKLSQVPKDSPMYTRLKLESFAIGVYLDAVSE